MYFLNYPCVIVSCFLSHSWCRIKGFFIEKKKSITYILVDLAPLFIQKLPRRARLCANTWKSPCTTKSRWWCDRLGLAPLCQASWPWSSHLSACSHFTSKGVVAAGLCWRKPQLRRVGVMLSIHPLILALLYQAAPPPSSVGKMENVLKSPWKDGKIFLWPF